MLLSSPAALWVFAFACDVTSVIDRENWIWPSVAFYALIAGVVVAFAAGVFEWFDYVSLDGVARRAALRQVLVNAGVFGVFAIDVAIRLSDFFGLVAPVVVSAAGVVFLALAGRLGGDPMLVRASVGNREASGS
jgi:uncharacterized membrane protein